MSRILCVIDGMTDPHFQVERYGHLASMGSVRYVDTCGGFPPETLHCVLRLLGVTDLPVHLRGYVEALGAGIPVRPDDLLLRGSCYTLDGEGCCTMPCCAPAKVEDPAFTYYRLGGYQALLVFPHMAHTVNNIVTQIPSGGQRALCPQGSLVLRHAFERLLTKERCMLLWGQSVPVALPPFPQKSAVICGKELVKGIARLLHMELFPVKGATGDVDTDLDAKTEAALRAAERCPFVLLHINGADEAAHRHDSAGKETFLRRVDDRVLSRLLASEHEIVVASDHGADPESGAHLGGPQPFFTSR